MSLRKQQPAAKQKAKQPQRRPQKDGKNGPTSRVDDRIKRRMSMRYADISYPTEVSVPDIPALPVGPRSTSALGDREEISDSRETREDPRAVDLKALDAENFQPDAYLKDKLANSTEAELKALESSLRESKDATTTDLRKSVFNNYEQFVAISKEISTLENDLLELRGSLSEWKSMPSLLQVDDSATAERRRITRSSIADLRTLYASQLQTLHTTIEGSAKFVPTTPGRHIVTEMGDISSLNPANYRVEHSVHFVLLDDSLLVAKRRRKRTGGPGRLVADRCWMLSDIVMQDVKDSADVTNVVKVRYGKEIHVYRTERLADKKALLSEFRQASEEYAVRKRKEREGDLVRRRSIWAEGGGGRGSLFVPDVETMPSFPEWLGEKEGMDGAKEKTERDALWISEFSDQLSVAIALREWDEAADLVDSGEKRLATTLLLAPKLTALTSSLTTELLHTLSDPMQRKSSVVHLTYLLQRLRAGPAARSTFLAMRSEAMRKRVRALRFEGSVELYISDLAIVVFTGIKHTADWFRASFKENETVSALVDWAKEQIGNYAEMFKKQVHGSDVAKQTVQDCLEITRMQNKKLLKDYSLDFSHLLDLLLTPPNPAPTPPNFSSRSISSPASPSSAFPNSPLDSPKPARPPRNLPPRSKDRPSSSAGRQPALAKREGMI